MVYVYSGLLYLLIAASPLFRGLYFESELLPAIIAAALAFLIFLAVKIRNREGFKLQALDICMMAFALAYILALFHAVNLHAALVEVLKAASYLMVYWMARELGRDQTRFKGLLISAYIAALLMAFIGIGAALGWFTLPGAYVDGHIRSTLQYHNALAVYLAAAIMVGWAMGLGETRPSRLSAWNSANYFLIVVLAGTLSRGTLILFPFMLLLFLLVLPARQRIMAMAGLLLFLPAAVLAAGLFYNNLEASGMALLIFIIGLALVAGATWIHGSGIFARLLKPARVKNMFRTWVIAGLVIFGIITAGWLYADSRGLSLTEQISPQGISEKFARLSLRDRSVQERLASYEDAVKIVKDYPLTGAGGGAWPSLYHRYASQLYWTKEVHNFYLKTAVETGMIGFLSLAALCFFFLRLLVSVWKQTKAVELKGSPLFWAAALSVLLIGLHSLVDFDLSLPAVAFLFFAAIGAVVGCSLSWDSAAKSQPRPSKTADMQVNWPLSVYIFPLVGILLAGGSIIYSGLFCGADHAAEAGTKAWKARNINEARKLYDRSISLDPLDASHHLNLALLEAAMFRNDGNTESAYQAMYHADQAISLDPGKLESPAPFFKIYGLLKRPDMQIKTCQDSIDVNPLTGENYEALAQICMPMAWACLDHNQLEMATPYFEILLQERERMPAGVEGDVSRIDLAAGQSALFLGEFELAREYMENSKTDPACAKIAKSWLPAVAWMEERKQDQRDKRVTSQDLAALKVFIQGNKD
ncbi:MAG: O-antigen ligase family protein [Deltaproteobacteria bacterium]